MKTFQDVLDSFRNKSRNQRQLGTKFEEFVLHFLKNDKFYKNRFSKVWLWEDWIRKDPNHNSINKRDLGIDLVAEEKDGSLCAIQCKCHNDSTILDQRPVDSFLSQGGSYKMKNFLLFCTGPINDNAYNKLQNHECKIFTKEDFEKSSINWSEYPKIVPKKPYELKEHQVIAQNDVINGFADKKRGKLIMACGTGKTLVSLRIAEKLAKKGTVLYLVPSISLVQQTIREWSNNAKINHNYVAVCSDSSIRNEEGGSLTELESPASTNPITLKDRINSMNNDSMTVIFSTYQSIDVVAKALDGKELDIIFCDEAHRTASIQKEKSDSYFTTVHDDSKIRSKKRLYMTATQRIFSENIIKKAETHEMKIMDMSDEQIFGPIFHELTFYDAVHKFQVLCDFKVIITTVEGNVINSLSQKNLSGNDYMLPLGEKELLAAVWNALHDPHGDKSNNMLQRVIAFCSEINSSKIFAGHPITYNEDVEEKETKKEIDQKRNFSNLVQHVKKLTRDDSQDTVDVKHIDGKDNARYREQQLTWLKKSAEDKKTCRILSNARCLSEGVDVPSLDGVVFLNPRKSVIDVVQAVGRVMRKSAGKEFGYVILPVGIPAGVSEDQALRNNKHFKLVWQVLSALRSHDDKLKNEINRMSLERNTSNSEWTGRIIIRHAYGNDLEQYLPLTEKLISGIRTKMIRHVGDINYYAKYGSKLGEHAASIESKIKLKMKDKSTEYEIKRLCDGLRGIINDSISINSTINVLSQHIVMRRVFDALFQGEFTSHNPISTILNKTVNNMALKDDLISLEPFYKEVDAELLQIKTREERQDFIKKIYENFFKAVAKKDTEQLGIVYTPTEIIDFILNSVEHVLVSEFKTDFKDRNVKVLDPFAGTGTFISRLLESDNLLGKGRSLYKKYRYDLFANELVLLAYYVGIVNIETTYSSIHKGGKYVPFQGMSYTDTLMQNPQWRKGGHHRHAESKLDETFRDAHTRVKHQRGSHLHVIVGNPPYSAGQSNFNDQNQNILYPEIDTRIADTYIDKLKSINPKLGAKNSMYDSYVRSLRWASDRIGKSGVIGFVTNASFIRSEAAAGLRACLADEFTDVWVFDLRGNARTQGEERKKEAGNAFGGGSRAPVAITILVKNPGKKSHAIHYYDIGNYHSREKKLDITSTAGSIANIKSWQEIKPDRHHDWLDQRTGNFTKYLPMGSKDAKAGRGHAVFGTYANGVKTKRDVWVYNSSEEELTKNVSRHLDYCNKQNWDNPVIDPKKAKWSGEISATLKKFGKQKFSTNKIRTALYRPFFKQYLYLDKILNQTPTIGFKFFPKPDSENKIISVPYHANVGFSAVMTDVTPDIQLNKNGQCFPLYVYKDEIKQENITDLTLEEYQNHYNDKKITKEDIFYYTYGILHHPIYRKKYANNLTRELPHIPMAPDFWTFSNIGKQLADLHLSWETCPRYDLGPPKASFGKYQKMDFARKKDSETGRSTNDKTTLRINGVIVFDNIPETNYRINGRTPLEWAIDRYKISIDKDSGIVNDATNVDIIPLIERLVHVGVQSDKLISNLSKEFEPKSWKPKKSGLDGFLDVTAQTKLA